MGKPNPGDAARPNRIVGVVLSVMLAVSMIPVAGLQSAFADETVGRPEVVEGDFSLEGSADMDVVAGQAREDGTVVADGLVYTVADGGFALVGFDGLPEDEDAPKEIVVPEAVLVDDKDTPVVAVAIAEGQAAESALSLTLPQFVNNIDTATLAAAFPNLASVELASPKASVPVAAGAAAMRAAYSSFGGVLYRNAWVATDGDASQTTLTKELVWAPPATVVARIPAECASIAPGAFADATGLKTVVCFGVMGEIPRAKKSEGGTVIPGAFADEQIQTVNIIVPQTGTVVTDDDRVSADVAVTDHSTMDIKREAWWKSGFASDRITLGEVYGSTTNALPVTEEGVLETTEAEVAYAPETTQNSSCRKAGIEPPASAIPTPVPDDQMDSSESGLVFTHLADMTLSVSWKGDPTATPSHLDIPAYATINGVTYPVTEIAPAAFKGAVFLASITIPETVRAIGEDAFEGCTNLIEFNSPSALKGTTSRVLAGTSALLSQPEEDGTNHPTPSRSFDHDDNIEPYAYAASLMLPPGVYAGYHWKDSSGNSGDSTRPPGGISFNYVTTSSYDMISTDHSGPSDAYWNLTSDGVVKTTVTRYDGSGITYSIDFKDSFTPTYVGGMGSTLSEVVLGTYSSADMSNYWSKSEFDWNWVNDKSNVSANYWNLHNNYYSTSARGYNMYDSVNALWTDVRTGANSLANLRAAINSVVGKLAGYYTKGEADGRLAAKLDASAISRYDTNQKIDDALAAKATNADLASLESKVDAGKTELEGKIDSAVAGIEGSFGVIRYEGVDEADAGVYPTSYRKGGMPSLHVPAREGWGFAGWEWSRAGASPASGGPDSLADAFAAAGEVTLTATWAQEAPKGTYFFTERDPLAKAGPAPQEHVIKVVLTRTRSYPVDRVEFSWDNWTGLIAEGASVTLTVGTDYDEETGKIVDGRSCTLARDAAGANTASIEGLNMVPVQFASRQCGLYVGISVPEGAVDRVVESYTEGSYVDSLVKMSYKLAG